MHFGLYQIINFMSLQCSFWLAFSLNSMMSFLLGVNGQVSYDIIDGDIEGQFRIDASIGTIYTAALLDRETTPSYSLVVMATDMADIVSQRKTATAEVFVVFHVHCKLITILFSSLKFSINYIHVIIINLHQIGNCTFKHTS